MDTRPVLAVMLAVLFVAAGCQAPANPQPPADATTTATTAAESTTPETAETGTAADGTATETTAAGPAAETDHVAVTEELPYAVAPIYRRVGRMMGLPESEWPHTVVHVENLPEGGSVGQARTSGFTNLVGIEPLPSSGEDGGVTTGAVTRGTTVTLYDHPNASDSFQRNVLAHEFVHVFQTQLDVRSEVQSLDLRRARAFLTVSLIEGSAEYVQERYGVRYQHVSLNQTKIPAGWKNASAYVRYRIAPYEYGSRYFAMRIQNASQVTAVYANPPRTAEQVLHGYGPSEERARTLTVTASGDGSDFTAMAEGTRGELFLRLALSSELVWERAVEAAGGWGMDRLLRFENSAGDDGYAWVLRWDDASAASEFTDHFRTYAARNDEPFRVASVTDETVVVFAGDESFVQSASASGTTANVTVRP